MLLGSDHVRVRVPATSANLGPGFDALGLALGIYDDVDVRALGSAELLVEVTGEGAGEVPTDEEHLIVRSLRYALDYVGAPQVGLHLRSHNRIPHGRGMGSSAGAVVAGVLAARMLIAEPEVLHNTTAFLLATEIEGHPDNAAPAILGGATVAWRSATTARSVLPASVPHADAAFTAGRAAILTEALCRRPDLLMQATEERLHQSYRAAVMPESWQLLNALRERALPAVISGAGPTVLVLGTRPEIEGQVAVCEEVAAQVAIDFHQDPAARTTWRIVQPGLSERGARSVRVTPSG
jgi:homoserine kinase